MPEQTVAGLSLCDVKIAGVPQNIVEMAMACAIVALENAGEDLGEFHDDDTIVLALMEAGEVVGAWTVIRPGPSGFIGVVECEHLIQFIESYEDAATKTAALLAELPIVTGSYTLDCA